MNDFKVKLFRLLSVVTHGETLHSFWVSKSKLQTAMQRLVMALAPAVKHEFAGTMARETVSREHSGKQKLLLNI